MKSVKCYIGFGSNLGDRLENLEQAAQALKRLLHGPMRASPVYRTPALVPVGAPDSWRIPFLNAVVEIDWQGSAQELLRALKRIEAEIGRAPAARWAPRLIDLDILLFGHETINEENLKVPHPGLWDRAFVLDPLKDLAPMLRVPGFKETVAARAKQLAAHSPLWMGILNLTPDSFSDGGLLQESSALSAKLTDFEEGGVGMVDLGAESTRPGATVVEPEAEWNRLLPALTYLKDRYRDVTFKPKVSVDTRHAEVAARALSFGIDCINDVSGGPDSRMLELLQQSSCEYVLMHSLSIPANPEVTLPRDSDPVFVVKAWAEARLDEISHAGITLDRVILDPGIGFGKTADQSLTLMRSLEDFFDLPVRLLIGHSRKSFIAKFSDQTAVNRDWESVGISMQMAARGVDILRVHDAHHHARAYRAFQEVAAWNL